MTSVAQRLLRAASVAALLAVPAAASAEPGAAEKPAAAKPAAAKPGNPDLGAKGTVHRGGPFTLAEQTPLEAVAKDPDTYAGKTVKVAGNVKNVCAKKGCWMVLEGTSAAARARITFKDYGFFVPKDSSGAKATVEGVLEVKKLSPEERAHLAEDAGKKVEEIPEAELRIVATAVQLQRGEN